VFCHEFVEHSLGELTSFRIAARIKFNGCVASLVNDRKAHFRPHHPQQLQLPRVVAGDQAAGL
jgi:hypothetical protein